MWQRFEFGVQLCSRCRDGCHLFGRFLGRLLARHILICLAGKLTKRSETLRSVMSRRTASRRITIFVHFFTEKVATRCVIAGVQLGSLEDALLSGDVVSNVATANAIRRCLYMSYIFACQDGTN